MGSGRSTFREVVDQADVYKSRQEVCESFEHFRSYHSGVYSNKDVVKGYLLGAYAARCVLLHREVSGAFISLVGTSSTTGES